MEIPYQLFMKNVKTNALPYYSLKQQKEVDLEDIQLKPGNLKGQKLIKQVSFFHWIKKKNINVMIQIMLFMV